MTRPTDETINFSLHLPIPLSLMLASNYELPTHET